MAGEYAVATRDELWLRGRLLERRLSHGIARDTPGGTIATDERDDALIAACDEAMEELRRCVSPELRMRLIAEARPDGVTAVITISLGGFSLVTDAQHIQKDAELLRRAILPPETGLGSLWSGGLSARRGAGLESPALQGETAALPLLWRNGSAAVLLHEAFGHPAEHGQLTHAPEWLHIDNPLTPRRASFRDVPLLRMTNLVASQTNAPFEVPHERLEVLLVDGGAYDPLTELVTLRIAAADLVSSNGTQRVAPFVIRESRTSIRILGASGDPIRYPGVICSREGQELVVGSHAPLMVTA